MSRRIRRGLTTALATLILMSGVVRGLMVVVLLLAMVVGLAGAAERASAAAPCSWPSTT